MQITEGPIFAGVVSFCNLPADSSMDNKGVTSGVTCLDLTSPLETTIWIKTVVF